MSEVQGIGQRKGGLSCGFLMSRPSSRYSQVFWDRNRGVGLVMTDAEVSHAHPEEVPNEVGSCFRNLGEFVEGEIDFVEQVFQDGVGIVLDHKYTRPVIVDALQVACHLFRIFALWRAAGFNGFGGEFVSGLDGELEQWLWDSL